MSIHSQMSNSFGILQWKLGNGIGRKHLRHHHPKRANAREASTVAKNNMTPPQQQSRRSQRQKKWEPVATPKGRNLYWWNSDTGESQWERPDEVSPAQAAAHAAHVLPATHESNTMSELTEVNQLWVTLRSRATVEAINGDWHRMNDPHTGERFYWNAVTDASQWKEPEISGKWLDPSHTDAVNSSEWTAVQTPAGRLLCYYDKVTGNSQLVQPETYAMTDRHATPELLLSVSDPRCTDVPKMRRLWTVILQRSTTQKTVSDWAELRDSTTGEIFYHCGRTEVSQWEVPDAFRHEIATQNEGGKAVHFSAAETHTSSNDHPWEAVKTPKGRNIYFWNRNTGESQWEHPDPSKQIVPVPSNGNETQDGHYPQQQQQQQQQQEQILTATPDAVNAPQAKKMWSALRSRSKAVRHEGTWSEMVDDTSGETFYYDSATGNSQWEAPQIFKSPVKSMRVGSQGSAYTID